MRNLTEAAASRCILELQAQHERFPWMAELERTWEHVAHTPGGMVFSTSPVDQARLLAVGLHHLLERLVKADIPLVFLAFPRLIEDPAYLYRKLQPVLPETISLEAGLAAHRATADPSKVRVGGEPKPALPPASACPARPIRNWTGPRCNACWPKRAETAPQPGNA